MSEVDQRKAAIKEALKDLNTVQVFEKLFDKKVFELIVSNTNLYARQNNRHSSQLDKLKKIIGVLILSGCHKLPRESLFWCLDEDVGDSLISKTITRQKCRDTTKTYIWRIMTR